MFLDPDEVMEPIKSLGGSADQMVDTIGRVQDVGVTHILVDPVARGGVNGRLEALSEFMTNVAPQVG